MLGFRLLLVVAAAVAVAACDRPRFGAVAEAAAAPSQAARPRCAPDNGGITLPRGFCAVVVGDGLGGVRHLAVARNGDVYAALASRRGSAGGVLALRDTTGDGRADVTLRFGSTGGTGLEIVGDRLYFASNEAVLRYRLAPGVLRPSGAPDTVVRGLPGQGGHSAKSLAFDGRGGMFVNIGSLSNACQRADRQAGSRGHDPCTELATRAGIWRFDAARLRQTQRDGERWATGIRNGLALAWDPGSGSLFAVPHGRDQLHDNWPALFTPAQNAEAPSEEFLRLERGADGGWPYCYHDRALGAKVLAPEYGGDGRRVGRCARTLTPIVAFPAHWAPNDLLFYTGRQFPARYRGGAFVAFHGSWNRAPLPQAGYRVAFVPFRAGAPTGSFVTFADGFARSGTGRSAAHRPSGLAQGPDGSLYVGDDAGGRIWRIMYVGTR